MQGKRQIWGKVGGLSHKAGKSDETLNKYLDEAITNSRTIKRLEIIAK